VPRPVTLARSGLVVLVGAALISDLWNVHTGDIDQGELPLIMMMYLPLFVVAFHVGVAAIVWGLSALVLILAGYALGILVPSVVVGATGTYALPRARAAVLAGLVVTANVAVPFVDADHRQFFVWVAIPIVLVALTCGALLRWSHARSQQDARRIDELEQVNERIRHDERSHLAHELHDIVAHDVTVIAMQARRAEFTDDPQKIRAILETIGNSAQQTLQDLRRLVVILQEEHAREIQQHEHAAAPPEAAAGTGASGPAVAGTASAVRASATLDQLTGETTTAAGFVEDLRTVVAALESTGLAVELSVHGDVARVPISVRQVLRRTLRELGTNVMKHGAPLSTVRVDLAVGQDAVRLTMDNERTTIAPIMSTSTGLPAIRERARVFGGSAEFGAQGSRWRSSIALPLRGAAEAQPS
jgi:signal transduction histidine kinase